MRLRQVVPAILVALLATACSGGEPEAAPPVSSIAVEAADTTTAPADTIATTSSTEAAPSPGASAPVSLAFATTQDVGRLFEVDGRQTLRAEAAGDQSAGSIDGGTIVQATSARSRDGVLWVRIGEPTGERNTLGWVRSDQLRPTTQFVSTMSFG